MAKGKKENRKRSTKDSCTENSSYELQILYHQIRSIGETLTTLDYDLADGIHLPGFGITLCQIAEKVKVIESHHSE